LTEKKFRPASAFTMCCSSDAPPPSVLHKFKFLASFIVQVSMSTRLPDVMLSVCLLSWTHTLLKC